MRLQPRHISSKICEAFNYMFTKIKARCFWCWSYVFNSTIYHVFFSNITISPWMQTVDLLLNYYKLIETTNDWKEYYSSHLFGMENHGFENTQRINEIAHKALDNQWMIVGNDFVYWSGNAFVYYSSIYGLTVLLVFSRLVRYYDTRVVPSL